MGNVKFEYEMICWEHFLTHVHLLFFKYLSKEQIIVISAKAVGLCATIRSRGPCE